MSLDPDPAVTTEVKPLIPGDRIRYGMSVGFDDVWLKLDADVQVQDGESVAQVWNRASNLVERLLTKRAESLKTEMKRS